MKTITPSLSYHVSCRWLIIILTCLVAFAGLLALPTPARAEVNLYAGTSSYTFPIATPSGTTGVGPQLSIAYNSSTGSDWLGEGWSLEGLGSIERLGPTYSPAPTYTASDTYRLNFPGGGKLVYTGVDPAGNFGNYFRTQTESFIRIEYVSVSNSWVVTGKDGTKYFFGQTAASQQSNPGNSAQVFAWQLSSVVDTHGTFWTVSYDKDATGGDIYPRQIVYTQGSGLACSSVNLAACRVVDFFYELRADVTTSYRTGAKVVSDLRLQRAEVRLGGQLVRKYTLGYTMSAARARGYKSMSQLTTVTETGADGTTSLPATRFTYHYNGYGDSLALSAANMAGAPAEGLGGPGVLPPTSSSCTFESDVNGDRLPDILVALQIGGWYYYPNFGGNNFGAAVAISNPPTAFPTLCAYTTTYTYRREESTGNNVVDQEILTPVHDTVLVDLDGDGLLDILYSPSLGQWHWWRNKTNDRNTGNDCQPAGSVCFADRTSFAGPSSSYYLQQMTRLVDMDGDGLLDIVETFKRFGGWNGVFFDLKSTWTIRVWRNLGMGAGALSFSASPAIISGITLHHTYPDGATWCAPNIYCNPPWFIDASLQSGVSLVDMNSDGLPDIVWIAGEAPSFTSAHVYYLPNLGVAGFGARVSLGGGLNLPNPNGQQVLLHENHRIVDMNGDGLPDILVGTAGGYYYYPLQANQTFGSAVVLGGSPAADLKRENYLSLSDMNGDNFIDFLKANPGNYVTYSLSMSDNHQLLFDVKTPFGGKLGFIHQNLRSGNSIRWVASQATQSDGLGAVSSTSYAYAGGKVTGWPHNEFRGYAQATTTDPAGNRSTVYFHQDDAKKGFVDKVRQTDSVGAPYAVTTNTYLTSMPVVTGVWRVDLAAQQVDTYDGGTSFKFARNDYAFDGYGNVRYTFASGTGITPRATTTDFAYNTAAYIVNRPRRTDTRINSAAGTKVSETWFNYDNLANGAAPTRGDLTSETRWLSGGVNPVTRYGYDSVGNRVGIIDAKLNTCAGTGYTTKFVFDTSYQTFPLTETNALCQVTSTKSYWGVNTALAASSVPGAFAFPGLVASVLDVNGVRSDSYWDSIGRSKAVVLSPDTAAFPTTTWYYGLTGTAPSFSLESRRENGGGSGTLNKMTYIDGLGRPIQAKSEAKTANQWATQDTWYNSRGLAESVTVPYITYDSAYTARNTGQYKTTTLYDAVQRHVAVTNPDTTYRSIAYTPYVVASTDEKFNTTTRTYDALNRLVKVVEPPGGGTTAYYYDFFNANGTNIQWIADAQSNTLLTIFDTLGRKTVQNDPDLGAWSFAYDANGNLFTQTDAKAQVLTFAYDKLNRLATKTYPNSGGGISYFYDDPTGGAFRKGRLWKVTDLSGSTTFTYDVRGRKAKVDKTILFNTYTTQYTYDSLDRVAYMLYPNNDYVGFAYNAQGLLDAVNHAGGSYVSNFDYNALGQITSQTTGNGKVTTYNYYPNNNRLSSLSIPGLQQLSYVYDNFGNITSIVDLYKSGTQSFGYDNLNRLTLASSTQAPAYTYSYDYSPIGNMKTGAGKTFTYPAPGVIRPHAPTSDGTCNYLYDANGNTRSRTCSASIHTYNWDADNRLQSVNNIGGTSTGAIQTSIYDYSGQRVYKVEGSTQTFTPFPHYRVQGGTATKYYFANGQRIAERDSTNSVFYYHPDYLGSSNIVSNSAGAEVKSTLFYPYGATRTETGTKAIAHKYTGQESDAPTGLYYYGARYYNPATMHFLSADSIIPNVADPQMLNRYSYVRNNPVRLVDPDGRAPREMINAKFTNFWTKGRVAGNPFMVNGEYLFYMSPYINATVSCTYTCGNNTRSETNSIRFYLENYTADDTPSTDAAAASTGGYRLTNTSPETMSETDYYAFYSSSSEDQQKWRETFFAGENGLGELDSVFNGRQYLLQPENFCSQTLFCGGRSGYSQVNTITPVSTGSSSSSSSSNSSSSSPSSSNSFFEWANEIWDNIVFEFEF